jgi:hypothetical protein
MKIKLHATNGKMVVFSCILNEQRRIEFVSWDRLRIEAEKLFTIHDFGPRVATGEDDFEIFNYFVIWFSFS